MKIPVQEPRTKGEPDYTYLEPLYADGGIYRAADGSIHLYWKTP